jgi:hypothetical protein
MNFSKEWSHAPIIPALRRLRQSDHTIDASLGYIVRPVSNNCGFFSDVSLHVLILFSTVCDFQLHGLLTNTL